MSLGIRLRMARKAAGFTQKSLAAAVGVSPSAVANYESGFSAPNENILIRLMNVLSIDANYLYADDLLKGNGAHFLSPDEKRLVDTFRALNAQGQQMALVTLESLTRNPSLTEETRIGVS